jgi:hypothetical protein
MFQTVTNAMNHRHLDIVDFYQVFSFLSFFLFIFSKFEYYMPWNYWKEIFLKMCPYHEIS